MSTLFICMTRGDDDDDNNHNDADADADDDHCDGDDNYDNDRMMMKMITMISIGPEPLHQNGGLICDKLTVKLISLRLRV